MIGKFLRLALPNKKLAVVLLFYLANMAVKCDVSTRRWVQTNSDPMLNPDKTFKNI